MQKKKIKMRMMSLILCVLMVFTSIPLDTTAAMSYSNSEGGSDFLSMIDEELERFESSGESELYKDYDAEDHLNDLEDDQNADELSLEMSAEDSNYITVSIEKYDKNGNGTCLIRPKRIEKRQYQNDDVISAIREAYGSNDYVKVGFTENNDGSSSYFFVTSVYDKDQDDSYLDNGEYESNAKWEIYVNNKEWSHTRYVPADYLKAGDVVRLVYTTEAAQNPVETNRDELIKIIGEYAPEIWYESSVGYQELQAALNKLVDLGATSEDIEAAENDLINAFSATAVEISQGEAYMLDLNKTATLKATVTPKNTKDKVVWSTDAANIATVDADTGVVQGISEGIATITATAGNASDSIVITVGKIPATNVVIKNNEDKITIEKRFDVQLETEVTPADTTDVVKWTSADETIATVDADGLVQGVSAGSTTITATAGNVTDTCQVQVVDTTSPYIYFRYADGSVQEMVNNTFTLTTLDVGKFVVGNYDEKVTWSCSDTGSDGSGGYQYRYWIDSDGDYNPFEVKKMQATVSGTGLSKSFYIDTVSSGISSIQAYIGDKEVSIDNPYEVTGIASGIPVTVKGLNKNSEWVNVPEQAFKSTSTDSTGNIRVYAGLLDINTEGEAEITITMIDNADAKTSFKAKCNSVKVETIKVHAPENFVIDKWDSQGSGYVGITHGYESSNSEYYITYTPSNATNQEVIWEDLTPEIAEFHELHSAGIVPKKAGQARFKVVSQSNPDVSDEVSINFTYKAPLTNAVISKSSYEMEAGTSEDLVITMVPENATEQRFTWTYSEDGIVRVNESVSADTTTRYISRKIIALSSGKVTVTGTPLDHTGNCQPIEFEVTVGGGSGNVETIDYLGMAKADINHGLSYLRDQINYNYGSEWTLFTCLRAGGTIENANNYFASVETELNKNAQFLNATDYARLVITLPLLGQNPTNFAGFNLVEKLYNNLSLGSQTSNQISWTLLALDSHKYEIPDNAVWTREKLIEKILTFQAVDGGFGLSGNSSGSVDMTGMILQALAPYNTEEYPEVQSAFSKAVNYLKSKINENVGYIAEGGENGCTAAQVLTALSIAKIDPTNSANGFVLGNKNLITNLDSFKQPSGFAYLLGQGTNLQGTQQITYALEAYRRYAENKNSLYDLTDIELPGEEKPEDTMPIKAETLEGKKLTVKENGKQTVNGVKVPVLEIGITEGTDAVKVIPSGNYAVYDCDGYFDENASELSTSPYGGFYTLTEDYGRTIAYLIKFVIAETVKETFTVNLPRGDGYTVVPESSSPIEEGENYSFSVEIDAAYDGSNMIVKANGNVLEKVNGKYTIENILSDQIITIEGVLPKAVSSITVKFAMFGDHVHEEGEEAIHTLYDGNLELWIDAKDYNVSSKAKVIDVIDLAFSENNLTYRNTGNYISHVTRNGVTLGAFTNGSLSGWMYTLNGAYSNLGVEEQGLKDGDIIVFYYTDDYTREDYSITLEKTGNVTGLINDLPENITLDDEAKVIAAEEGYLALNEYQKILIRNYEKLAAAGKELAELKKSAEDEEKASKVEDFIDEIGEVTLSSEEKIDQAFAEYEKLTDIQKKLVDNYDELIAAKNKLILLENAKHEEVYRTTGDYFERLAKESKNAVFGSEWVMFGLSRSGRKIPAAYIKDVASYVAKTIDGSGRLDRTRATENSRLILALTAAGNNAMDVAGYNLLSGLSDMKFVTKQGINGSIFALIALQCHEDYEIPKVAAGGTQTSVDALIDEILDKELTTGGWNLGGKEKPLDADVTAMAIQALAPYYNDASVKKAIDKALDELSKIQNEEGAFGSVDGASSESCAQVIVALTSLGINPETDMRFVKNGNSVVDALCSFYVEGGGFKHVASGELNGMASEQGYYAMAAYMRLLNNQTSLYDMNDVVLNGTIVSPNEPDTPDMPNTETSDADKKAAKQVEDIIDAIGRVTIYSENRIKEARRAYNNLTSAQKKLVSNYDVLLAAEEKYEDAKVAYVEDLIDSIGTVSLNSKTAINRARIAYNLLSAASKAEVYNYDKLVAAETLYAKLLSEDKNTVNKAETNKSNKTNKTNATTVKNSPIEKTKIAEYVDDLLESINRDSLNGEIFDAIMAYEELTDVEKISLDKESLVADLKQMLSEKIHVDQKTGILVSGAEWDVRLVVEDVSDMGRIQSMQDKMENAVLLGLWDISLVKMYGNEKYQPEETVLVKIPLKLLGDYTSYEGLVIAHYTDEGQTEYLNCTIMGEYLVFNAIDFSDYAVIGYNDGSAFHDALNGTDDYNGTAMEWIPWTIAGGCSMALLAVLFLMLKKRNEKINKENR